MSSWNSSSVPDEQLHTSIHTNGVERQHEQLKYTFLTAGSPTDLITVIVRQLVPSSEHLVFISDGTLPTE